MGPIISIERDELCDRAAAREWLNVPADTFLIYVSAGGGGNSAAEQQLKEICEVVSDRIGTQVIVACGPLYNGPRPGGKTITWRSDPGIAAMLNAFDLAISAAGYNSYHELLHAGIPTIFVPLPLVNDDQTARADRAAEHGEAVLLPADSVPDLLFTAIEKLMDPGTRQAMSLAARTFIPANHARDTAQVLLQLVIPDIDFGSALRPGAPK